MTAPEGFTPVQLGEAEMLKVTKNFVFSHGLLPAGGNTVLRSSGVFRRGPLLPDSDSDMRLWLPGMPATA